MVEIFGHTFEHLIITSTVGNPVFLYRVQTEEDYYIHTGNMEENIYKTATGIYATDDLDAIIVLHESELPEGAEILEIGGGNAEIASEEATEADYISALEDLGVNFNG